MSGQKHDPGRKKAQRRRPTSSARYSDGELNRLAQELVARGLASWQITELPRRTEEKSDDELHM